MPAAIRDGHPSPPHRRPRLRPHALCATLGLLVSACGGTASPEIDPEAEPEAGAIAPECREVDDLEAQLPDDQEPTGTTGDVAGDLPRDDESAADEDDEPATAGEASPGVELGQQLQQWGEQEAAESFAGLWVDQEVGGYVVAFATDVDDYAQEVRERFHPGLAVAEAEHTYAELREVQQRIFEEPADVEHGEPGAVHGGGADVMANRTRVSVFDPDEQRLAELTELFGATTICFEIEDPPEPLPEGVEPLAKASDWRDDLGDVATPFAIIEVADDRESAERAWSDNVPDDLDARDDELPAEPGVYGDLETVDFDEQTVIVWSSGQSGSCPGWLSDISSDDGAVTVEVGATQQMCTDDYNPYRMVLAVDRDRLPPVEDLPHEEIDGVPDGEIRAYPQD